MTNKQHELILKIPGYQVIEATVMPDGNVRLSLEPTINTANDRLPQMDIFRLMRTSELKPNDPFLTKFTPKKYTAAWRLKQCILKVIETPGGVPDIFRPSIIPSYRDDQRVYSASGEIMPATGTLLYWMNKWLRGQYAPEYYAMQALRIQELYQAGWPLEEAWEMILRENDIHY